MPNQTPIIAVNGIRETSNVPGRSPFHAPRHERTKFFLGQIV